MVTRSQAKHTNGDADGSNGATNGSSIDNNGVAKNGKSKDGAGGGELINGVAKSAYKRNVNLGFLAALVFMSTVTWLVWTDRVRLSGIVTEDKLTGFGLKSEFVFRNLIVGVLWLIFNVHAVIVNRVRTPALDPLNGHEHLTLTNRNILTNSIEQFVITAITQLSVISYLNGYLVVRVIPLMNLFYLVGRIAFFAGYPRYRTFGWVTTSLPPMVAASYAVYKYGTHLGIY